MCINLHLNDSYIAILLLFVICPLSVVLEIKMYGFTKLNISLACLFYDIFKNQYSFMR